MVQRMELWSIRTLQSSDRVFLKKTIRDKDKIRPPVTSLPGGRNLFHGDEDGEGCRADGEALAAVAGLVAEGGGEGESSLPGGTDGNVDEELTGVDVEGCGAAFEGETGAGGVVDVSEFDTGGRGEGEGGGNEGVVQRLVRIDVEAVVHAEGEGDGLRCTVGDGDGFGEVVDAGQGFFVRGVGDLRGSGERGGEEKRDGGDACHCVARIFWILALTSFSEARPAVWARTLPSRPM